MNKLENDFKIQLQNNLGTIRSGLWNGTPISTLYGGTGAKILPSIGGLIISSDTAMTLLPSGTTGQLLKANTGASPSWLTGGKSSGIDADLIQGVPGQYLVANMPTGIICGGLLAIEAGAVTFSISAGCGVSVKPNATHTAPVNPSYSEVSWTAKTGVVPLGLNTHIATYVSFDSTGTLVQQITPFTDEQYNTSIIIGRMAHANFTSIGQIAATPTTGYAVDRQIGQFIRAFGPLKLSGNAVVTNGANLKLNREAGTAFAVGRNYVVDPDDPSKPTSAAATDVLFGRGYRNGSGGFTITPAIYTAVDPSSWDNGSGTLQSVLPNKWTIQRLFGFTRVSSFMLAYYGRAVYGSSEIARQNITFEEFSEDIASIENMIFLGYLIIESGETNLNNAIILQAGMFRNTSAGGGGLATLALDDLSDVTITSPSSSQVLTYNGTGWINAAGGGTLDALSDVVISSPTTNQVVLYNGSSWINAEAPTQDPVPTLASELTAPYIVEDFISASTETGEIGVTGWSNSGGSFGGSPAGEVNHPGIIARGSSSLANAASSMYLASAMSNTPVRWDQVDYLTYIVREGSTFTTSNEVITRLGLVNDFSALTPTTVIIFEKEAATNIYRACMKTASGSVLATASINAGTSWTKFKIRRVSDTQAAFSFNGGSEETLTLASMTGATTFNIGFQHRTIDATGGVFLNIDFFSMKLLPQTR